VHLISILAAAFLAIAAPDPTTVTVTAAAKSFSVAAAESGSLLSIPDFAAGLGGRAQAQPGAALAVEIAGHRIVAADGVATVAFDDRVVVLAHPTRAFAGTLYAPWEFFEKALLPAAGISADYDRAGKRIRTRSGASGAAAIDMTLVHLAKMTQLVFRESAPIDYETSVSRDGFTVTFKRPVIPAAADRSFEDPFVSRVHIAANTAAVVFREPGLAVNAYPLKSPDRLVLEITRPETAAPGPAPRAIPAPAAPNPLAPAPAPRAVVIDAGHGGDETGAIGPGNVVEKEITLDIASRLAAILAKDPAVRPVLTRTTDTIVSLDERAAIANHEKAAVFVSIHANSSRAAGAHGSETYYLSLGATDPVSAAVANDENTAAAPPPGTTGEGAPPADLDFILWDMAQSAHLKESAALADSIQNELNALLRTENRGIKQAPFRVLVGATMPAVLVETAFISNPDEAKRLATPEFRQSIAEAIARAIASYLQNHPAAPPA
jgi:N-acetylmuramoyl-L-alanine amidase